MFLTIVDFIVMGFGIISVIIWLIFYIKGNKFNHIFESLDEKEYPLKELYGMGYSVMDICKYTYKSNADRKLRQTLSILYDEKYTEFYIRVVYAQKLTISFTVWNFGFILYGLSGEIGILMIVIIFALLSIYYFQNKPIDSISKRSEQLLSDFAEMVSNLALLTNAGMVLREAWNEVSKSGDRMLYQEMQKVNEDMNNGISESDALYSFGIRCVIPQIKKFTSTIIQGITKGNKELAITLQQQSKEVWADKKQNIRRQGEKASSKLLIPIFMMFIGVIIMIVVPIFTNMF